MKIRGLVRVTFGTIAPRFLSLTPPGPDPVICYRKNPACSLLRATGFKGIERRDIRCMRHEHRNRWGRWGGKGRDEAWRKGTRRHPSRDGVVSISRLTATSAQIPSPVSPSLFAHPLLSVWKNNLRILIAGGKCRISTRSYPSRALINISSKIILIV